MKRTTFLFFLTLASLSAMAEEWKITFSDNYAEVNTNRWKTVYAYVWDDNGYMVGWPGSPMTQGEDGTWSYSFTHDEFTNPEVIFHDDNGDTNGKQTDNLEFINGGAYNRYGRLARRQHTVYFDNSASNWDIVYVYIYGGTNYTYEPVGAWGATAAETMQPTKYGILSFTFTTEIDMPDPMIIFHSNTGKQTDNLTLVDNGLYNSDGYTGKTYDSLEGIEEEGNVGERYFSNLGFDEAETMTQLRAKGEDPDNEGYTLFEETSVSVPSAWDLHYDENSKRLLAKPFLVTNGQLAFKDAYEITAEPTADHIGGGSGTFNVSGEHFLLANCYYGDYSDMTVVSQTSKEPMPKGVYRLSATIDAGGGLKDKIALFARLGEESTVIEAPVDFDNSSTATAGRTSLVFELTEPATVTIGIKTKTLKNPTIETDPFGSETYDFLWFYADDFELVDEELDIDITAAQYATFFTCHSYIMPDGVEGSFITSYTALDADGHGTGSVTSEVVYKAGDEVPGSAALLLHATTNIDEPTAFKAHITAMTGEPYDGDAANYLHGSATPVVTNVDGNTDDYYFYKFCTGHSESPNANKLGFYWDSSVQNGAAFNIDGHRAWLAIPRSAMSEELAARLTGFVIGDAFPEPVPDDDGDANISTDDATTGISGIASAAAEKAVYNLQGVRVKDASRKGIYIIDGRKTVVR